MGNENHNQIKLTETNQAGSAKLVSIIVLVFSIGLNLLDVFSQYRITLIGTAVFSIVIFFLAHYLAKPKLITVYLHLLNLVVIGAVYSTILSSNKIILINILTYSTIIYLLVIALLNKWNFVHHIITVLYFLASFIALNFQHHLFNTFLFKENQHTIILPLIVIASVVIALVNQFNKANKVISEDNPIKVKSTEDEVYKIIFDNLSDGLFRLSIEGKVILANDSFAKLLGHNSVDDIMNSNVLDEFSDEIADKEKFIKIMLTQKRIKSYRMKLKRKDKVKIVVKINARLVQDENEQPLFIEGSIQDVTQQILSEEEKLQQIEELKNEKIKAIKDVNAAVYKSNIKAQFLASMSHEIKTPINSIIGFLTLIEKRMFDSEEELQEFAQNAKTAADSLLDIINNVLDISKIEAGKMELDEVEFNFREEIQKASAIITPQVSAKNLNLTVEIDDKVPVFVIGDPVRFRQVVLNILSNSVKYTDRGEIILRVSVVKFTQTSVKLKVTIIDTGRGIPRDKLPLIFKPYTQVKQKKWTEKDGSGLGLMITKQFVELMGGEIQLISEEGIGTTVEFTAFLKIQKSAIEIESKISESEVSDDKEIISLQTETAASEIKDISQVSNEEVIPEPKLPPALVQSKKNGKRILLVEDNPISQKVEKKLLSDIGYEVEAVSNAHDAIEAIKTNVFDLVLMDIEMPDMDGLTATQKIRGLEAPTNQIPIIAVTAHSSMKDREKCLAAGMDDYIAKPININFMKIIIDQWLNR